MWLGDADDSISSSMTDDFKDVSRLELAVEVVNFLLITVTELMVLSTGSSVAADIVGHDDDDDAASIGDVDDAGDSDDFVAFVTSVTMSTETVVRILKGVGVGITGSGRPRLDKVTIRYPAITKPTRMPSPSTATSRAHCLKALCFAALPGIA